MFFLGFNLFKPDTWLSGASQGIMGTLLSGLRTLFLNIITIIYELIVNIYNLFERLCSARLLSNDILDAMSKRIGIILGLIMFFYIVFSFIQMLIEPEKITDKGTGAVSIIKKTIIVIVMLGVSNGFFNTIYVVQDTIIKNNIIPKVFLPYNVNTETSQNFGSLLSVSLIKSFYYIDMDDQNENKIKACKSIVNTFYKQVYTKNKYDYGYMCLNESLTIASNHGATEINNGNSDEVYIVSFNGIIAILVGAYVVYMLAMYCLKVGVRMIQLAFLEIISPMAIISYMSPKKDNMFGKWTKIYFATYIDVFIRIAIINLVVFMICIVFDSEGYGLKLWGDLQATSNGEKTFFAVVIILALLTFAKKAPDLIKELLPASASKLGFGMSMKDIVGLEKGAKIGAGVLGGALGGAAIGLIGNKLNPFSAIGGALRGGLSGFKGQGLTKTTASAWKNQKEYNKKLADVRANGGSWLGYQIAQNQKRFGMRTAAENYDLEKSDLEQENSVYNQVATKFDDAKKRAKGKIIDGDIDKFSDETKLKAQKALEAQNKIELLKASAANLDKNKLGEEEYNKRIASLDKNELGEEEYNRRIASLDKNELGAEEYKKQLNVLNQQITIETTNATKLMDDAVAAYINEGKDIVTVQKMTEAQAVIDNNKQYDGFKDLKPISDFDSFKKANDDSLGKVSENSIKLTQNAQEGKKARVNAK